MKIAKLPKRRMLSNLALAIIVLGLPLLVFATYKIVQIVSNASADTHPRNVVLSNLTPSSITISWTTDSPVVGYIIPVKGGRRMTQAIDFRDSKRRYTHYVELTGLDPATKYEFIIKSGNDEYRESNGGKFSFVTAPISSEQITPNALYGKVVNEVSNDTMVYVFTNDKTTYPSSNIVPKNGGWAVDLSSLRKISDNSILKIDNTTHLRIVVISGKSGSGVVDGIYSVIVDGNGGVNNPISISETDDNPYSYFPPVIISVPSNTPTPNPPSVPNQNPPSVPNQKPPTTSDQNTSNNQGDDSETPFVRKYRIIHQLEWIDMFPSLSSMSSSVTSKTGAESIRVSNITDTGFTVSWVSKTKEVGTVSYGTSKTDLSKNARDSRDGIATQGKYYVHNVNVSDLQPNTTYYYEVKSGNSTYDNGGSKYTLKTVETPSSPPAFEAVKGTVNNMSTGSEGILFATIEDKDGTGSKGKSLEVSSLISENNIFSLTISNAVNSNGAGFFEYTSGDNITFDIMSTVRSKSLSIDIAETQESDVSVDFSKLRDIHQSANMSTVAKRLTNYGILGATDGTSLSTTNPSLSTVSNSTNYTVSSTGSTIPKTGIMDTLLYPLFVAITLIILGIVIYLWALKIAKKKGKMKERI